MKESKTILAVGSIALDTLDTPNGKREGLLGGSATYFALSASLFTSVKIVGVVGNDFPESGWNILRSRNINTDNVSTANGKTFRWGGQYNQDYSSRDTLFTDLGVFESFSPIINQNDCLSPMVYLGNIQPDLQLFVTKKTVSSQLIASDTMNLWIDLFPSAVSDVAKISNLFLINHEEARQYTGIHDLPSCANKIHQLGPEIVIIKMGAEGSYLSTANNSYYIPTFTVNKVLDPTGAGDSFAGGLMGSLANMEEPDFVRAVLVGSAIASCCVEGFGTESLQKITTHEINRRVSCIEKKMFNVEKN